MTEPSKDGVQISSEVLSPRQSRHGDSDSPSITKKSSVRDKKLAVATTWFSFFIFGMVDGTTGALSPYIQAYYGISYTKVSLLFLCQVLGYGAMSLSASYVLGKIGRRWLSILGAGCISVADAIVVAGPPFGLMVFAYTIIGFAAGTFESMLNAYAGSLAEASMVLGFLHGFYGLGAAISPILATQMVVHGISWHWYYAVLLGVALLDVVLCTIAFWGDTTEVLRREEEQASARYTASSHELATSNDDPAIEEGKTSSEQRQTTGMSQQTEQDSENSLLYRVLHDRFCLVGAVYVFLYLGLEISTGGWIAQYLQKVRDGSESATGFVNSGFWFGITAGRFILAWPASHLFGEWLACQVFTVLGLAFELVFWLSPDFVGASVGVALMGFFIGPTFPLIMELATRQLEPKMHVAAIGFVASFGSIGGAFLPFVIGIGATASDPQIVPYILTALMAACLIVWMFLPGRRPLKIGRKT